MIILSDFLLNYSEIKGLKIAKWVTIVVGILGTGIACLMATYPVTSLFFFFQEVVGLFGSALAGIFILGIFLKRSNWVGALSGALMSVIVLIFIKYYTPLNFYIYPLIAIPVCVIGGYIISLITPQFRTPTEGLVYGKHLKNKSSE